MDKRKLWNKKNNPVNDFTDVIAATYLLFLDSMIFRHKTGIFYFIYKSFRHHNRYSSSKTLFCHWKRAYTEKTIFSFPFKLNGIWSWWQFSFRFEPNGISFGSNRKENHHHDHIPFNVKGNGNKVFSVYARSLVRADSAKRETGATSIHCKCTRRNVLWTAWIRTKFRL